MKKIFSYILTILLLSSKAMSSVAVASGEVEISISPSEKSGVFNNRKKVKYHLQIKNESKVEQTGTLYYELKRVHGQTVLEKTFDTYIPVKKSISNDLEIPFEQPGSYFIRFVVVLNKMKKEFNFNFVLETGDDQDIAAGDIKMSMKPANLDGIFVGRSNIHYEVKLQNTYQQAQNGTIAYQIKDAVNGQLVSEKSYDIRLAKSSSKRLDFSLSPPEKPGIYLLDVAIHTSTYDDTTHHSFGYEIAQINHPFHRPPDFDAFWKNAMTELAAVDPAYTIEEDKEKTTSKHKVYRVEMSSMDNMRIYGWLSIPTTLLGSKFPVLIGFGGYQVPMDPVYFDDFAGFMLNARGSDFEAFNKRYPQHPEIIIMNVQDPDKYIFRAMYMDCIRAVDFIFANEQMGFDLKRVAVFGGSQGGSLSLMVAGLLGNKIQTCMADNPTYCDYHLNLEMANNIRGESFIVQNMNRFLDEHKSTITQKELLNNLSYFEIQNFAPKIKCPVLLGIGLLDPLAPPATTIGMYNKLNPEVIKMSEIYIFPDLGHEVTDRHNTFKSIWFYEKLAKRKK